MSHRIKFLGFPVDSLTMEEAGERLLTFIRDGGQHQITAINANKLWQAQHNPKLAEILTTSALVIPEYAVVWGARVLGTPLAGHIGGIMLLKHFLPLCAQHGIRIYFLGGKAPVTNLMIRRLRSQYPNLNIAGYHHGYFDVAAEQEIVKEIKALRPQVLVVALGSPKQEMWIHTHGHELGCPVMMGVGGSFDVLAGIKRDTPAWMRRGLEWLFRLIQDPRNLWRRYLVTNPWFVYRVLREKWKLG
jgi:N-acetylglucosaminyldiphosphoundecaprenol N-acetyl-beta-D-mannosaminyltransferase